ncbi:hypothetical protein FB570_111118 [Streptomyces sp. T12]|nr:hypothetical protein FB570_111118 [Streptomyces sp. T12]
MLARWPDEVIEQLPQDDPERTWRGRFVPMAGHWGYEFGWALECENKGVVVPTAYKGGSHDRRLRYYDVIGRLPVWSRSHPSSSASLHQVICS